MPGLIEFLLRLNPRINPAYPTASQGPTLTVPANVADHSITYPKIQEVSANVVLGGVEAGTVVEIPMTGAGRSLVAADSVNAQRSVLGVSFPVTEAQLQFEDVTTWNVLSVRHGLAPKSPGNATRFLNGAATPDYAAVKDSDLSISDITTNNASTSAHGFLKKLNGNVSTFLDGSGNFSVPAGSGNGTVTSVGVTTTSLSVSGSPVTTAGNITINLPSVGNLTVLGTAGGGSATASPITLIAGTNIALTPGTGNITIATSGLGNVAALNLNGNASTFLDGTGNFTVPSGGSSISPFYYTLTKPAIADFTVRHSASGTYTSGNLGSGRGAFLTSLAPGSNAERLITAEKALAAGNFTATAFLVPSMNWSEFKSIGLFYRDSATDRIVGFTYDFDAAATKFRKHRWSDISTFNAQTGYTNVVSDRGANPIWIQLKNVSGNVSMNYSLDGENFMTVVTESLTAYAASPDKIGWILNANDNGAGYGEVDTLSCYSWTLTSP